MIDEIADFTNALPGLRSYKTQCDLYGLAHDYRKATFATATFHLKAVAVVQSTGKKRDAAIENLVTAHRMLKRTVSSLKSAGKEHKNLMSQLNPILAKADAVMNSALAMKQSAA